MLDDLTNSGAIPTLAAALRFAGERQKLIANNIANVSTPNFIQRDVSVADFRQELAKAVDKRRRATGGETGPLPFDNTSEVRVDSSGKVSLTPETPHGSILFQDKNNRDLERLMQDSVENAAFYRMNVDFLRTRFDILKAAITQRP
ncbi:MAG: flagellar basal body rod protein FlgB [Phycisphaerales bacterium]|nr:flagellar basal body rod protein FlgB [Planctomycetota bacterium]